MSLKQRRLVRLRSCAVCGEPSNRRSLCTKCSPRKATRAHIDKYRRTAA